MLLLLFALLSPSSHAAEAKRTLAEVERKVDRAAFKQALEQLDELDRSGLTDVERGWLSRLEADAHRQAAVDDRTADPAFHLDKAYAAHADCVALTLKGTAPHRKHCEAKRDDLLRVVDERAGLLLTILEFGGAAAPSEVDARCDQLQALSPDTLAAARCRARLAWIRRDVARAEAALKTALQNREQAKKGELDLVAGRALYTPLFGHGDPQTTQRMLDTIPADLGQTPRIANIRTSLERYTDKLAPRKAKAYADNTAKSWGSWLKGLTQSGLDPLALREAEEAATRFPDEAGLHEVIAITYVNAAARMPPETGPARIDRLNQQRRWLQRASQAAEHCAATDPEHPRCAAMVESLTKQIAGITGQLSQ